MPQGKKVVISKKQFDVEHAKLVRLLHKTAQQLEREAKEQQKEMIRLKNKKK